MKKYLTGILAIGLAAALSIPAFAANATNDGTNNTDVDINGTFHAGPAAAEVIAVDLVWDDMSFTYTGPSRGTWNPATHQYENPIPGSWTPTSGADPKITLTNHSNVDVKAAFAFTAEVEGVKGDFTKDILLLNSAAGTEAADAPQGETAFSVDGTAIAADKTLGTITMTVERATIISTAEALSATANQTGVFTLGGNIDLGGSGLTITSGDYTLDLNGFTLSGSADREGVIIASEDSKVTIKNGTIHNTNLEYGWAVHAKSAKLVLENCKLISYSSGLFSDGGTATLQDCHIKTILAGHFNITNYQRSTLTISGNLTFEDGAGLSNQLEAATTALAGTYNFDVSKYVDATLYNVTNDGTTWTVTAK